MTAEVAKEQARLEIKRACGESLTSTGFGNLPGDLIERAVRRLGWLAFFFVLSLHLVHWSHVWTFGMPKHATVTNLALVLGTVSGLAIAGLAWSRKLPSALMLDVGLLFEVIGALTLGLIEFAAPSSIQEWTKGLSGIALWIAFFILVVPSTLGRTALAALASALMGPIAFVSSVVIHQQAVPELAPWFYVFFPNFMVACWAIVLSRFIYSLGADLNKAREAGSYELLQLLGRGGMGEVWRAKHRMLARPAAIKLILPEVLASRNCSTVSQIIRRFEREAQATASLTSPHTVQLYDFGLTGQGSFYYAMELLDGLDLETLVERHGPVPAERVTRFLIEICESLEEAHRIGLVHRDIKPANIYAGRQGLQYDFIKVLDFGLAKFNNAEPSGATISGITSGTPAFMAPEIALGEADVDARSDIYAVGCVAYWLLTGRLVFERDTPIATMFDHVNTPPVPPSGRTELEIPESLERIIMTCLEKDPSKRPSSAKELARRISSTGLHEFWTSERAERWWQTHVPDLATVTEAEALRLKEELANA